MRHVLHVLLAIGAHVVAAFGLLVLATGIARALSWGG